MIDQIWLIALGFVAGIIGSMIGLGGGFIIVPILTFLGFPPANVASNSLFAVFSNAISSTLAYSKQSRIDYSKGLKIGLVTIPGTILGAFLSSDISSFHFQILFGIVLIFSAGYIILKRKINHESHLSSGLTIFLVSSASFIAGIISSLFGIGGGVIFVPLLIIILGLSMKKASATSQFILIFASVAGLATHSFLGHPDFTISLFLAIGSFGGGFLGAKISKEITEIKLKILVSVVMLGVAIKLIIDSLGVPF